MQKEKDLSEKEEMGRYLFCVSINAGYQINACVARLEATQDETGHLRAVFSIKQINSLHTLANIHAAINASKSVTFLSSSWIISKNWVKMMPFLSDAISLMISNNA
jgi:hypothetical protein